MLLFAGRSERGTDGVVPGSPTVWRFPVRYLLLVSLFLFLVVVAAAGCGSGSPPLPPTPYPTHTPYPTYTPLGIFRGPIWLCRYVVQPGDTLEALAAYYQTTIRSIQQENNLQSDADLRIGDVIHIPVGRMECPPTPTPRRVTPVPTPTVEARPTAVPLQERDCFPWDTASTFLGQTVCIGGWVVSAEEVQGTTYLYFGQPPETHFRVVIPADSRGNFPGNPLQLYNGRHILVRGRVESAGTAPLIVLRNPANMRVLE